MILSFQLGPDSDVPTLVNDDDAVGRMIDAIGPSFDPSVQCTMRLPGMAPVLYSAGLDGVHAAWLDWLKRWAGYRTEVEKAIDGGERIVVVQWAHGRLGPGQPEVTLRRADIWTVRDHKVVHVDFNVPVAEALAAVTPTT
jgi:hypothetical protein